MCRGCTVRSVAILGRSLFLPQSAHVGLNYLLVALLIGLFVLAFVVSMFTPPMPLIESLITEPVLKVLDLVKVAVGADILSVASHGVVSRAQADAVVQVMTEP